MSTFQTEFEADIRTIPRLSDVPSYTEFLESYLKPNRPVIIGPALVKDWPALQLWARKPEPESVSKSPSSRRMVDWDYLEAHYGLCEVSVANCSTADSFGNLECEPALFGSVVAQWKRGDGQSLYAKDWHLPRAVESPPIPTPRNQSRNQTQSNGEPDTSDPQLKPTPGAFYSTPSIFRDDWMNAYYTAHTTDDFRFVYCGAAGTFTPLHRDVYCSYSWSTNVVGRKRWWMFPPADTAYLFMKTRRVCVHDVRDVDEERFPEFGQARPVVVVQEEGETIFVPSGWYHQVENLTACISINHNWCNSVNLPSLYASMCDKVVEVEEALDDVREMLIDVHRGKSDNWEAEWRREFVKIVQDVVQQDAGWNWSTFWRMVLHALRAAVSSEHPETVQMSSLSPARTTTQPIFPPAPPELHPSLAFIVTNVKACCENFVARDRHEGEGEVGEVVTEIQTLLHKVAARS